MKCPFRVDDCTRDCALYIHDQRLYSGHAEPSKIEGCVFVLQYEELKNQNNRAAMMHKELGDIKNNGTYQCLIDMGIKEVQPIVLRNAEKLALEE